jgi:hypothetical protein
VKQASWRRLARIALGFAVVLAACLVVAAVLLRYEPAFYRPLLVSRVGPAEVETLVRRAVTKASAAHAALSRAGPWDMALSAEEVNAWLAVDLPRNHPQLLPRRVTQPRLAFEPGRVRVAARVGYGPLSAVVSGQLAVVLHAPNQLTMTVEEARLGAVPLPTAVLLRELGRRLARLGLVTEIRPRDGGLKLEVYMPSTHDAGATSTWLESLAVGAGELLVAGQTRSAAETRPAAPAVDAAPPAPASPGER